MILGSNVVCSCVHAGKVKNCLHRSLNNFRLTLTIASISKQTRKNCVVHQISVRRPLSSELKVAVYIFASFVLAGNMLNTSIHIALIELSANENTYVSVSAVRTIPTIKLGKFSRKYGPLLFKWWLWLLRASGSDSFSSDPSSFCESCSLSSSIALPSS